MTSFKRSILLTIIVLLVIYILGSLGALAFSAKSAFDAKKEISAVVSAIEVEQLDRALESLFLIEADLYQAKRWKSASFWLRYVPVLRHDYIVYDELLNAGQGAATSIKVVVQNLSSGSISRAISFESLDLRDAGKAYLEIHDEIMEAYDHLIAAAEVADKIHTGLIPQPYREDIIMLQRRLQENRDQIISFRPFLEALPATLGQGDPHEILVLLENSDELRPTGGFIGNVARLTIDQGEIIQFSTDDVYSIDGKVLGREELRPPEPISKYMNVEYWYLRDSNWSPDYPTSAQNVKVLYEFEMQEEGIDTVLALTPFLIEGFLDIVGPIETGGIVFTSENLIEALQYRVEYGFAELGQLHDERKQIIKDLADLIKQRFFTMNKGELKQFYELGKEALDRKEILIYTTNPQHQALIAGLGWDGRVIDAGGDYIYVSDANVAALKTDRVVERKRKYSLKHDGEKWKAVLELTYINNGQFDYRTTRYRTYTRVYVPIGSELIASNGFVETDKSGVSIPPLIYSEFGKTVFAGFLSVEPGEQRSITLEYYLPDWLVKKIELENKYSLYLQKQPGVNFSIFEAEISSEKKLFSFAPSSVEYQVEGEDTIQFTDYTTTDMEYVVSYK